MKTTPTTQQEPVSAAFLPGSDAVRLTGLPGHAIRRLAKTGHIGTMRVPGLRPRYSRDDLERIAAESIRPATAK